VAVEVEDGRFFFGLEQAEPSRDFLIGLLDSAEVLDLDSHRKKRGK
jgi:hypothetical protein